MVVYDLDVFGSSFRPAEADPVLVVDPDRVLTGSIPLELLEAQPGQRERSQGHGRVQTVKRATSLRVELGRQRLASRLRIEAVEDVLGAFVGEGDDHVGFEYRVASFLTLNGKDNTAAAS